MNWKELERGYNPKPDQPTSIPEPTPTPSEKPDEESIPVQPPVELPPTDGTDPEKKNPKKRRTNEDDEDGDILMGQENPNDWVEPEPNLGEPEEEEDDEEEDGTQRFPTVPTISAACLPAINEFTPPMFGGQQGIEESTRRSQAVPSVTDQSPYGIGWISPGQWAGAAWDRTTTIDLNTMTTAQACAWLWPSGADVLRGTRELYDDWGGFNDPKNPTPREIEEYIVKYILHFRKLTRNPVPLTLDGCLMLRALWSDERKYTTKWDTLYPGTCGSAFGPCQPCGSGGNDHCGESFIPDANDQLPYIDQSGCVTNTCTPTGSSAAGISSNPKADIPWSIKLSRVMQFWFCSKDAGHFGPFMRRERLGFHFLVFTGAGMTWRGKWAGTLHTVPVPTDW